MTRLALEIHDAGLIAVQHGCSEPSPPSPGIALWDGDRLLVGTEAAARSRRKPRFVHRRFWRDLDTTPAGRPFPRDLTLADLAHAHLSALWDGDGVGDKDGVGDGVDEVLLAVPGPFDEKRLGLLLGIARACGLPVRGLVDAALAATAAAIADGVPGRRFLHLDLELHRAVLSELHRGPELVRRRVEIDDTLGLISLHDRLARGIAERFVAETRFDPLHSAAAEQELVDRLPAWLEKVREAGAVTATLETGGERTVKIEGKELEKVSAEVVEGFLALVRRLKHAGEPVTLLLSPTVSETPGLDHRLLNLRDATIHTLSRGSAARGALLARAAIVIAGEELPFVVRLPLAEATATPNASAEPPGRLPTHLLHDGVARRITGEPLVVGSAIGTDRRGVEVSAVAGVSRRHLSVVRQDGLVVVRDHSSYGTFLNGERVAGLTSLAAGDRLRLGPPDADVPEIEVIAVEDD